jgi:hypothetical protein
MFKGGLDFGGIGTGWTRVFYYHVGCVEFQSIGATGGKDFDNFVGSSGYVSQLFDSSLAGDALYLHSRKYNVM